jgi:hypothetical protein
VDGLVARPGSFLSRSSGSYRAATRSRSLPVRKAGPISRNGAECRFPMF